MTLYEAPQERPPALAELAQLDQWVISKLVQARDKAGRLVYADDGSPKLDKPPFSPLLDKDHKKPWRCSHSAPEHWASYDTARAALPGFAWLGFVFHEADPYSGIDLDGCARAGIERIQSRDDIEPWALRIIDLVHSYTEVSPSGRGVKIFARGTLAETIVHSLGAHKGIEIYSSKRYFTVTGAHLAGTPTEIRNAQTALDRLAAEYKPAPVEKPTRAAPKALTLTPRQNAGRASLDDVKARFAAEHTLESLLAGYGAEETKDGYTCPFCTHTHETTLYIGKLGRLFSYSPNCKLHTTKGWDAFGLYVKIEHNDNVIAAARALNPIAPRQRQPEPLEPERRQQTPAQAADAARKRAQRATEAAEIRASITQAASQDARLSDSAQLVLMALLDVAGSRAWCRPSVIRLKHMIGDICERSVFNGLHDLVKYGYIANSQAPGRTTVRTFLRMQAENPETGALHPDLDIYTDLYLTLGAREGGAQAPEPPALGEADTLDTWQIACDEHGADELAFLDEPTHQPEPTPAPPLNVRALPEGARIVRPSSGPYCWASLGGCTGPSRPRTTPDALLIADAWGLWDAMQPAAPATHWRKQGFNDSDQPELASYEETPEPLEPPAYTGRAKHDIPDLLRFDWAKETIRVIDVPADACEVEQAQIDAPPVVRKAPRRRTEVSALDRYRVDIARMSESQLAGEIRKHTATLKKHKGAVWLEGVRDKLAIVQAEIDERGAVVELAPASQARRPQACPVPAPQTHQAQLFGGAQ